MIPLTRGPAPYAETSSSTTVTSSQPIMLAAATLLALVTGVGGIVMWRATSGSPAIEADHVAATRQLQARTVQASERLVEKTKGLEATQQESIDQLQMVQDQLQSVRQLLAAQQADTKRLSEQVGTLTFAIEGLRQSFASAQTSETSAPSTRNRAVRTRAHASRGAQRHQRSRS